mmetsp:Transcript_4910/g.12467  ORF Transcript_4910/g.12467 Transcript_4910/m.12467 type:complete len:622 (+) Transcript_4910:249-2114(+)|eukprot:CAMPEP_0197575860 /NCGR_PEP_ID=MMETSP1326-20131121/1093_1 /TAXON_ID=1155430 /ORGANISM="Genus nov. species nov., Strain RCC2288" /LENGTH=621 /DNA_ID=CAMNT_0043138689 /DNA_START=207 /DNA_END=2072 /DNA_ORIENTATION=-
MSQAMNAPGAPGAPPPAPAQSNFSATSLYVGDLETSVTEAQLYELFSTIGPVVSIRVCRDLITRRSLGYAYVNFQQGPDAARAVDVLNFQIVNGKPVRIMYSQRDPALRKSGVGNIFIKNLDREIDHKALYDTFAQFGQIVSAKVACDMQGQSKGYGFVQFDTSEAAQTAIDKVNGMLLNDKQVYVGPFQRRGERGGGPSTFNNVYVKNVHESVLEDKLREVFEKYGALTSVVVMKDAEGKSKGFGFVCFEDTDAASKAVEELDGFTIEEKPWVVCRAQKKAEREAELKAKFDAERRERMEKMAGANLYIKNLEDTTDDAKLRDLFAEYGTITSCRVMRDTSGASRGSAFVAFSSADEATRAVTEMNGKMAGTKPLYVALAQRKEDRRMRLQAQFAQRAAMAGGIPSNMGPYMPPPGVPGAPMYYGQPPPGMVGPPQPQPGFGFQPVMPGGPRPGGPMGPNPNMQYVLPIPQRQGVPGQRGRGGRGQQQNTRGGQQGGRGQQNMRFNPNMRNDGMPPQPAPLPGGPPNGEPPQAPDAPANPVAVLAAQLPTASPDQQRMLLGEALYPLVDSVEPASSAKITGMLLEMDQSEVLHLIESPDALRAKVQEALAVLKAAAADDQ